MCPLGKRLLKIYDPVQITANAFLIGTICYLPLVIPTLDEGISSVGVSGLIAILYLGLFCSVLAYGAWYYVLSHQQAGRSAVFLTFIPLFTITLSFFIDERPTLLFFLGALLIIGGVLLTQRKDKETLLE